MQTFYAKYQSLLISSGFSITKLGDYWSLIDGEEILLQNRRLGDMLAEAKQQLGM